MLKRKNLIKLFILLSMTLIISNKSSAYSFQVKINKEKAVRLAKLDAEKHYDNLSIYQIEVRETSSKWLIDFVLKNKSLNGGGPLYIISKKSGKILKKVYEQ